MAFAQISFLDAVQKSESAGTNNIYSAYIIHGLPKVFSNACTRETGNLDQFKKTVSAKAIGRVQHFCRTGFPPLAFELFHEIPGSIVDLTFIM